LANALIEVRQDLIADKKDALAWGLRLARLLRPILADRRLRGPADFGSRTRRAAHGRGKRSRAT
jgi:predicted N-formylglutamate amidohydrolase